MADTDVSRDILAGIVESIEQGTEANSEPIRLVRVTCGVYLLQGGRRARGKSLGGSD